MTRIIIQEDPDHPDGGFARVLVEGMAGQAIAAVTIGREGFGADSMGPRGWQVASARIAPEAVTDSGANLAIILGPDVVEHLEAGPVRLGLPEIGLSQVVMWPDIAPLPAAKRAGFATAQRTARVATPAPPLRGPDPLPAPDPDATVVMRAPPVVAPMPPTKAPDPTAPASARQRRAPLYALILMFFAALGLGGWIYQDEMLALVAESPAPPATPAPAVVAASPAPDALDTATPVAIAAMNLPPAQILAVALRRQARGAHQDALLLLELAAAQNHPAAISALARLYDPASFTPGGALSVPNPGKAAQYWRAAEQAGDPAAAAARQALRERLQAAAQAGDAVAALALQDNWP